MHIRERFIVHAQRGVEQACPEARPLLPSRSQVLRATRHGAIAVGCGKPRDHRADRRTHAEDKVRSSRHRARDAPRFRKNLAHEGHRLLGREDASPPASARRRPAPARDLSSPVDGLKVQIQEQHWAGGGPLENACIGQSLQSSIRVKACAPMSWLLLSPTELDQRHCRSARLGSVFYTTRTS